MYSAGDTAQIVQDTLVEGRLLLRGTSVEVISVFEFEGNIIYTIRVGDWVADVDEDVLAPRPASRQDKRVVIVSIVIIGGGLLLYLLATILRGG